MSTGVMITVEVMDDLLVTHWDVHWCDDHCGGDGDDWLVTHWDVHWCDDHCGGDGDDLVTHPLV